ncbi:MAG: high-affinity branched-chain amino acid ABC transporter permease LivM [SAR324 cluster bacterium]|nr:high-affinity branched-chain amino acid ABC transporter permease LivM [SAR324 cluster bacterium]
MNIPAALKDSAVASLIALALFVPMIGLVLKGQSLNIQLLRALFVVAAVFAGRMLISMLLQSGLLGRLVEVIRKVLVYLSPVVGLVERRSFRFIGLLLVVLVAVPFLPGSSNYLIQILSLTLVYVILATGLNIVVGLAGLLDLGFVAFFATGAYGYAMLAQYAGLSFWAAIPLTAGIAAGMGCLLGLPVLRMHGDYLAIVTLGFGEIIRILLVNMIDITGGPNGISVPRPTLFGLGFTRRLEEGQLGFHEFFGLPYSASHRYIFIYLLILAFTVAAIWIFKRLREMPIGRAWEALREDEIACKALGINHTTTKLSAFTLGATFGGVGGVFFAAMEGFINPSSFTFVESAIILSIVVLGGMGSIVGVILAAMGITLLPELFREFENYRMLVFGLAMVFIMIWRPGGLLKVRRKTFARGGHGG